MLDVSYTDKAIDFLLKMPKKEAIKIRDKINLYAKDPQSLQNQIKKLIGEPYYRLRVGDYRVIFSKEGKILTIEKIGHRREIYKK